MPAFAVYGLAQVRHAAQLAEISVGVAFTGDDRATVRDDTLAGHAAVVAEAKALVESGAATGWTAGTVSVSSYDDYQGEGRAPVRRHQARGEVVVTLTDFDALGTWAAELGERPGIELGGIAWRLDDETRTALEREVRIAAVRDAITKAHDYAAALSMGEPTLERVFEEGLRPDTGGGQGFGRASKATFLAADTPASGQFELRPDDIEVSASISADFAM